MMPDKTLAEGKQHLRTHWEKGVACPCCGQLVKLYKRKLNSGMAVFLIRLYRLSTAQSRFHHASAVLGKSFSLDYSILEHWGMIEKMPNHQEQKKTSGFWAITPKGRQFVEGHISVPLRVHIFNNKIAGWSDDRTTIQQALGNKFSYPELMGFESSVSS